MRYCHATYFRILITGVAGRVCLFMRRRCRCLEAAQSRCSSSSLMLQDSSQRAETCWLELNK